MLSTAKLALLVLSLLISEPACAISYIFSGYFDEPGQNEHLATFTLELEGPVQYDSTIYAWSPYMRNCSTPGAGCESLTIFVDAAASGLLPDAGVQGIGLRSFAGTINYYYFPAPALSTPGTYESLLAGNPATLAVSIPEPHSYISLLFGLATTLIVLFRRKSSRLMREVA